MLPFKPRLPWNILSYPAPTPARGQTINRLDIWNIRNVLEWCESWISGSNFVEWCAAPWMLCLFKMTKDQVEVKVFVWNVEFRRTVLKIWSHEKLPVYTLYRTFSFATRCPSYVRGSMLFDLYNVFNVLDWCDFIYSYELRWHILFLSSTEKSCQSLSIPCWVAVIITW